MIRTESGASVVSDQLTGRDAAFQLHGVRYQVRDVSNRAVGTA